MKKSFIKLFFIFSIIIALILIGRDYYIKNYYFENVIIHGEFVDTTYLYRVVVPMHGSTGTRKQELCSKTQNKCWKDTRIGQRSKKRKKVKLVRATSRNGTHFLNTELGIFLPCINCQKLGINIDNSHFSLPNFRNLTSYSDKQDIISLATYNYPSTKQQLALVRLSEIGVTITPLMLNGSVSSFKGFISPNKEILAWFDCDEMCSLINYHIQTKKIERQSTICQYSRYLEIKWEDEGPVIRQHSNAIRGTKLISGKHIGLCKNNNGDAAYPVWTAEEYKAKYS